MGHRGTSEYGESRHLVGNEEITVQGPGLRAETRPYGVDYAPCPQGQQRGGAWLGALSREEETGKICQVGNSKMVQINQQISQVHGAKCLRF